MNVVFLSLGIPIAYSLGLSGFCYFVIEHPEILPILPQRFLAGIVTLILITYIPHLSMWLPNLFFD